MKNNLTVREDKIKGIYIAGVTEEYVTSVEELLAIMSVGEALSFILSIPLIGERILIVIVVLFVIVKFLKTKYFGFFLY